MKKGKRNLFLAEETLETCIEMLNAPEKCVASCFHEKHPCCFATISYQILEIYTMR